ncbi:MAG: glycosyltransferase family 39 protein [Acidobacteriota bacterium]|nr:glycosyltransferase family 39 protein [Acidobacteriota bacterium]
MATLALRLFFYFRFPHITGDSLIYGDIARNWLDHGIYGLSHAEGPLPTWIRLPGYPAFLAACFVVFGREHYHAVLLVQIVIDVIGCFFVADLARRAVSGRAARLAFLLAALCPFTANYTAAPLAETLSIFFVAVASDCAVAGFTALDEGRRRWSAWTGCAVAVSAGMLLRPDGGILLVAIGLFLLWRMWRQPAERVRLFWAGALILAVSVAPLVPWTIRNWHRFHKFEPLAPRYASDPDEFVPSGFDKWMRTWALDYTATEEVYWQVPGDDADLSLLPSRAFDSEQQRQQTYAIFDDYKKVHVVGPELNARFEALANDRIRSHPLRYYMWLPLLRSADMWLRPRTEMLPLNSRWWELSEDPHDSVIATAWGLLNFLYVFAAVMGVVRGPRPRYLALMLLFVVLRSAFLGTLENPEPRYTLECYPVVFVLGAAWISGRRKRARVTLMDD